MTKKEKQNLYYNKYYHDRLEEMRKRGRDWYKDNREKVLKTSKEWKKSNPEKVKQTAENYRYKKLKITPKKIEHAKRILKKAKELNYKII